VCHNSLHKYQFSEVKPSQKHFWEPSGFPRQLLVRVVNHTLLLIRSVSRFSKKCQFSEVKPSQTHFWEPPSFSLLLLLRVVNHTLLLIRSVSRFSTTISVQWGQTLTNALLRTFGFFSAVTRARSKSHTTPNTDCVTILYKISVQWGQTLTDALLRTSEFFSAVTRARSKSHTTPNMECVTILYNNISSVRSNPHKCTLENRDLRVFPSLGSYSCA